MGPTPSKVALRFAAMSRSGALLPGPTRQRINAALIRVGMDGNERFRSPGAALARINTVLGNFKIEWDEVINSFALSQPKGRVMIDLAFQTEDPFSPVSIENTALAFHWDTMPTGIEVIAYVG